MNFDYLVWNIGIQDHLSLATWTESGVLLPSLHKDTVTLQAVERNVNNSDEQFKV